MTQKRFTKLLTALLHNLLIAEYGTVKGHGKGVYTHRKPDWPALKGRGFTSYEKLWNSGPMQDLREIAGM